MQGKSLPDAPSSTLITAFGKHAASQSKAPKFTEVANAQAKVANYAPKTIEKVKRAHQRFFTVVGDKPIDVILAAACGIDAAAMVETVAIYNKAADDGHDPAFGRGSTPYNRSQGGPRLRPNPNVRPIGNGPYYAVNVLPGSFGTFAGIKSDEHARIVRADGSPIPGLYVAGNDMASIMGGRYPAGGINLGPAMTFGFIAARHIAGEA